MILRDETMVYSIVVRHEGADEDYACDLLEGWAEEYYFDWINNCWVVPEADAFVDYVTDEISETLFRCAGMVATVEDITDEWFDNTYDGSVIYAA